MSPAVLFSLAFLITLSAALMDWVLRRRRSRHLRNLAAQWRMNYSPSDQFRLTPRVARSFPVPGASRIRVVDLIYGIESDLYRYIFTAEYTAGIVTRKRRMRRAGSFSEPRDHGGQAPESSITLAPAHLPLLEQYQKLTPPLAEAAKSEIRMPKSE